MVKIWKMSVNITNINCVNIGDIMYWVNILLQVPQNTTKLTSGKKRKCHLNRLAQIKL